MANWKKLWKGKKPKKAFSFWKTSFLSIKLQNHNLQKVNHKLKLANELRHLVRDDHKDTNLRKIQYKDTRPKPGL